MGHPIAHSRSPAIHSRFAAQTGEAITYEAIHVEPGCFRDAVDAFRRDGGRGLNVTLPFKEQAFDLVERATARARRAGAVNTISIEPGGSLVGDNTDGAGLVRDLCTNHAVALAGLRILLVGAGGAARGVAGPILDQGPAAMVIANRTPARGGELVAGLGNPERLSACSLEALRGAGPFDVVVNATAASLAGEVPALPEEVLGPATVCYDMAYGAHPTAFMGWARSQGVQTVLDGLGMLVEQAAESFARWRGIRPETGPVIQALRATL